MSQEFLSITRGELWLRGGGAAPVQIESPFARELIQRAADDPLHSHRPHGDRREQPVLDGLRVGQLGVTVPLITPEIEGST